MTKCEIKILCVIPARGGSKGVLKKNIRPFCGKPLLAYSIEHARKSKRINRICVSTDDSEISRVSHEYGAEVVDRPVDISQDTSSSESALIHVVEYLESKENYTPDIVVFLQATSPIRYYVDLDKAIDYMVENNLDSLLSVTKAHKFLWKYENGMPKSINYDFNMRPRRQDLEPEYLETGSFYIFRPWVLKKLNNRLGGKIGLYEINFWHSFEIDSYDDFALCEWIYKYKNMEKQ